MWTRRTSSILPPWSTAIAMTRPVTILDLMTSPKLLGPEFSGPSWDPWRVYLKALFGLEMTNADWELYTKCTGREAGDVEWRGYQESFVAVGRRGGKSIVVALIAVYAAVFKSWEKNLSPGEVATISIVFQYF